MGKWEFAETDRGPRLYLDGKALTAPDPHASAARRLAAVDRPGERLFLILSPVFPYALDEFVDSLPESCRVAVVEPEPQAIREEEALWGGLRRRKGVRLLFGLSLADASEAVGELVEGSRVRSLRAVWMTGAARQAKAYHDALIARGEESLALAWQNRATVISLGRLWIRNLLRNLLEFDRGIGEATVLADRPILVAGAGPSLEDHGELIQRLGARVRILAVDTALPYLLHLGVHPDAVVSVDSQQLNVKDLIPPPPPGVRLLADATAAPSFVRSFPREERYAFVSHFAESSLWELLEEARIDIPIIEAGGSVGTTALLLADRLRRSAGREELPILLTGLDFAFSPGLPHARMTYTHILTLTSSGRLAPEPFLPSHLSRKRLRAPGKGGESVRTDYVLAGYAARLRAAAPRFSHVWDLTS
ncbi:MAG: 6-hydroxymethylpterin diphosphokinase MptE-like protein, partial [Spirochaetaceae bacterium]